MIKKAELLDILNQALLAEEKSVPLYTKHLSQAVFWTGWDKELIEKIRGSFEHLAEASTRHKDIVQNLMERIRKDSRDAF